MSPELALLEIPFLRVLYLIFDLFLVTLLLIQVILPSLLSSVSDLRPAERVPTRPQPGRHILRVPDPHLGVARGMELVSRQPSPSASLPSPIRSPPELCRPQFVEVGRAGRPPHPHRPQP